jgi:hypothetical protein
MAYRILSNKLDNESDENYCSEEEDLDDFISGNNNTAEDVDEETVDDYDVENYDTDTLFKFLNLDKDSTDFQIKDSANNLSAIMKNKKKNDLAVFFEDIRDQLLEWKKEERYIKNSKQHQAGLPVTFKEGFTGLTGSATTSSAPDSNNKASLSNTNTKEASSASASASASSASISVNPITVALGKTDTGVKNNKIDRKDKSSSAEDDDAAGKTPRLLLNDIVTTSDSMMPTKNQVNSIINIDTFFRNDYLRTDPSNYIQDFADPINNVVSMSLLTIEIPNIWYSISAERSSNFIQIKFNKFRYRYTVIDEPDRIDVYDRTYDFTIPDGNYTAAEIETTLNNLFSYRANNDESKTNPKETPIFYLRMAIDVITGKATFRIITNGCDYTNAVEAEKVGTSPYEEKYESIVNRAYSPDMTVVFNFLNEGQTLLFDELKKRKTKYDSDSIMPEKIMFDTAGWMFGFREPKYTMTIKDTFFDPYSNETAVTYKGFISSEGIYGGLVNTYIFLSLDDFTNNYKKSVITNSENFAASNNILAKIPIGSGSSTLMVQGTDFNSPRVYSGPVNINKMRIKLLDRFGNTINLNKNNYTLTLSVTQTY